MAEGGEGGPCQRWGSLLGIISSRHLSSSRCFQERDIACEVTFPTCPDGTPTGLENAEITYSWETTIVPDGTVVNLTDAGVGPSLNVLAFELEVQCVYFCAQWSF